MFQLYKSRNFGLYFKDTFGFLKMHGKHFFKNYLTVNGFFILILIAMLYIFYSWYENFLLGIQYAGNYEDYISFMDENPTMFIVAVIFFFIIGIPVSIVNYAFTPIYFKLYEKHRGANFTSKEIFGELRANLGKLVKYFFATIVVSLIAIPVVAIFCGIMFITIIGAFFLIFPIGLLIFFYHSALMEYLNSDKGVFACYSYSWKMCFEKFLPVIGAIGVFFLLASVFQSVFPIIELIIKFATGLTTLENLSAVSDVEKWSLLYIVLFSIKILTHFFNLMISAIIQVNHGVIYYSLKDDIEKIHTINTIDEIGLDPH